MLVNTVADLQQVESSAERTAFLQSLLNDYITYDDAVYPEGYNRTLQQGDNGYITPVLRKVWNAGAAASWGFNSRDDLLKYVEGGNANSPANAATPIGTT
jgi:hypothetical protein